MSFLEVYRKSEREMTNWLNQSTWIVWHKRTTAQKRSLVWDPRSRQRVSIPGPRFGYDGKQQQFPFRQQFKKCETVPSRALPRSIQLPEYPILQFWTATCFYAIAESNPLKGGARLMDSDGEPCGYLLMDGLEDSGFYQSNSVYEFALRKWLQFEDCDEKIPRHFLPKVAADLLDDSLEVLSQLFWEPFDDFIQLPRIIAFLCSKFDITCHQIGPEPHTSFSSRSTVFSHSTADLDIWSSYLDVGLNAVRLRAALFLSRIVLRLASSSLISGTSPSGLVQMERVVVMITTPHSINIMMLEASPIMARASAIFARR